MFRVLTVSPAARLNQFPSNSKPPTQHRTALTQKESSRVYTLETFAQLWRRARPSSDVGGCHTTRASCTTSPVRKSISETVERSLVCFCAIKLLQYQRRVCILYTRHVKAISSTRWSGSSLAATLGAPLMLRTEAALYLRSCSLSSS